LAWCLLRDPDWPVLSIQGGGDVACMIANLAWLLPVIYLLENPARKS
jgi:hypothetical protein